MKKFFLIAAMFAASVAGANADSKLVIPSVDEAQANGWEALWGDYKYGYVMPENYVLIDNEEISLQLNKAANVSASSQVKDYTVNLQMGSSWSRESNTQVWMLESLYDGMFQPTAHSSTMLTIQALTRLHTL